MKGAPRFALTQICVSALAIIVLSSVMFSQTVDVRAKPLTDTDVQLLRQDLQAAKNKVITDTMTFNEKEAAAFWPVYKEYAAAQHSIADKRLAVITDYAQHLDKMNDANASDLTTRLFAIDDDTHALRKTYFDRFEKALGAKRAAKFFQVDSRLTPMIDLQLASEVPLIP